MGYSQAVRHQTLTLAFSLVRIQLSQPTKKELLSTKSSFFVIQAAGLVWNQRARALYGIATQSRMESREARIE